jgi:hypothetical protein
MPFVSALFSSRARNSSSSAECQGLYNRLPGRGFPRGRLSDGHAPDAATELESVATFRSSWARDAYLKNSGYALSVRPMAPPDHPSDADGGYYGEGCSCRQQTD